MAVWREFPEAQEAGKPAVRGGAGFKSRVRQGLAAALHPRKCGPRASAGCLTRRPWTERSARTRVTEVKWGHMLWALGTAPRVK